MFISASPKRIAATASVLALAAWLGLWPAGGVSAATIALDDFSSGGLDGGTGWAGPWHVSGGVDVVDISSPGAGSNQLRLRGIGAVAYRDVDLSGWSGPELAVWVKLEGLAAGDFASMRVGPPGSLSEVGRWDSGDADGQYRVFAVELSDFDTRDVIRVQFEASVGSDNGALLIDSVTVFDDQPPPDASAPPPPAQPRPAIVLDGGFDDWAARASISDPQGDARQLRGDILAFYWGDSDDDETMYWMVQRPAGQTLPVTYSVHLDMNNNGSFRDAVDRVVEVRYFPRHSDSKVDLKVRRADNNGVTYLSVNNSWGESIVEGGSRVEFGVPFDVVGFTFGSALRMYVESDFGDRAPDSGDIQWSPIPVLGYVGLGVLMALGVLSVWWLRLRRYQEGRVTGP